jgi:hypothetical protein
MVIKLFKAAPQTPRRGAQKRKRDYLKSPIGGFMGLNFMREFTPPRIKLAHMSLFPNFPDEGKSPLTRRYR